MATLVNANFWIYFIDTEDVDRVKCKICKKSLNSKRSFNLRQHLKQSHKIEVRVDKKFSNKRNNQQLNCLSTYKGVNFWAYFTNSYQADRVACKICAKALKSNNEFNLRQHLKHTHKIEVRLQNRHLNKNKDQIIPYLNETASHTSGLYESPSLECKISRYDAANIQTFNSNDSCSRASTYVTNIDIKEEILQDATENHYVDKVQETAFVVNNNESAENYIERSIRSPQNALNDSDMLTASIEFQQTSKKGHADEKSKGSNIEDNFEEWIRRRKLLLEVEAIEMQNYKVKLDIWEREQHLHLNCSKFTKDIQSNDIK